ncbi:MAG TPA: amidohydrolase family protein [Candidatus Saccharimonadales bacterium]|jgi:imidazolonepropionase-like amidohydrolase|nr:amidohydrolase family protein [Candidatus Saccharimonadales bacterium]
MDSWLRPGRAVISYNLWAMRLPALLRSIGTIAVSLLLTPFILGQSKSASTPIVITHATVINPGTSSVRTDQTVVVRGGRITSVAATVGFQPPKNALVIDATGQFLIPGLWDMHVHSAFGDWFPGGRDIILPLFIANGVTGVRDMGGDIPVLSKWRKEIAAGQIIGPRMVISGPMLDGYLPGGKLRFPSSVAVTSTASAVAAVDSLKKQGVDFIKVQSVISRDDYMAAAAEARKQGLPIVGHVPDKVRIAEAVAAGQKSIEHLMGLFEGCSTEEDKFIQGEGNLKMMLTTQDSQRCDALTRLLAQSQTWQVPTLAWQRGGTFLDQRDLKHQPLDKYVPAYWRDVTWRRFTDEMMPDLLHDPLALRQEYFARNLQMVGVLHHAGVPFMAGTDAAPGVYIMPGFSLHDELANFVEAGLTPMESLQTATSNPAKFLGMEAALGSIDPGKIADLVLLSANPLEDIRNTQKITAVIVHGRLLDRAALDQVLMKVEAAAKSSK